MLVFGFGWNARPPYLAVNLIVPMALFDDPNGRGTKDQKSAPPKPRDAETVKGAAGKNRWVSAAAQLL